MSLFYCYCSMFSNVCMLCMHVIHEYLSLGLYSFISLDNLSIVSVLVSLSQSLVPGYITVIHLNPHFGSKLQRASHLFLSDCDRMCGLQIELKSEERCLSILGVYMPSGKQSQDVYDNYFDPVEHCISQLSNKGPLLVLGNLNAHLRCRDTSLTNFRGN